MGAPKFPIGERVGLRMVRDLTDRLDNIDVFVEEHGAHAVLSYLLTRSPGACQVIGCRLPHAEDGRHRCLKCDGLLEGGVHVSEFSPCVLDAS